MKKFLLVDGNLLLFQSFYASYNPYQKNMISPEGITTNGVHVFLITLCKLLNYLKPDYLFIAFDANSKTKRHQIYQNYKSGRNKPPEIIFEQFDLIKIILNKLNIEWLEKNGEEADDLIATLVNNNNCQNFIFSKDKDLLQLVDNNTCIIKTNREKDTFELINLENFKSIYNINPIQIPDFKGIAGDNSDNLPGVQGIGDKGAIKLLNEFNTLEDIYNNIELVKGKTKEKLLSNKNSAFLCKTLAILNKNVDMELNLDKYSNFLKNNIVEGLNFLSLHGLNKAKEYIKGIIDFKNEN
ncbi:5'-3' exonuclease H3TH domain-containing protein [Mycoplasma sp. 744]|uniref:5'-3' exonuclease n=1 Tax=unclassified Mycoplasma TaxID=2683645 RepID=UPI00211CF7E1|nr:MULTISPECIES: 5'-3' exonuclease H3TH domain-containing protein [unclassified Mycoplasma]MEA4115593.1 5'-3' exonuclease H3TH domain-containing protein [Mycoplasma sp. 744]UUM19059.1 5'-3' exonuclease [Mycoplasma sp. 1018B]